MRRIRTECPQCGKKLTAPDVEAELKETKEKLRTLQRSVASNIMRVSQRIKKLRGQSNE